MTWANFTRSEFACKHCGENKTADALIDKLQRLRTAYGRPLIVSSAYRCPAHNAAVSSTGAAGPHTTGRAVDLAVSHAAAFEVLRLAFLSGEFTGIGVQQKGGGRFVHLDDLPEAPGQPRPTVWSYP